MRSEQTTVARGNNRNNGGYLGFAALYASNALSYSNGNNWRSRPTFDAVYTTWHNVSDSEPETPLNAACLRYQRNAVKNVHERPVSRPFQKEMARTVVAQKGWGNVQ